MSLERLMGKPLKDLNNLEAEEALSIFAMKTQDRNTTVDKPEKYRIAVPMSFGIVLGASVAVLSRRRG